MENILIVALVLLIVIAIIGKVVNKLFDEPHLKEEFKDIIAEVDKMPLLPKEAEMAKLPVPQEPEVFEPEVFEPEVKKTKPVTRKPEKPKKRGRKSKVDV